MGSGNGYGARPMERARLMLDLFLRQDRGYTTVAVAIALLMSVALAFGVAVAEWGMARSGDVQEVADAAAMSGENCVAAFCTVAQVLDACVLSMGLLGVMCGAGMVVAAVPSCSTVPQVLEAGRKVLDTRRIREVRIRGLERLEKASPHRRELRLHRVRELEGDVKYAGLAVPYPSGIKSDFSHLDDELDDKEMEEAAKKLQEASKRKKEAMERANEAKERAWRADNVDDPSYAEGTAPYRWQAWTMRRTPVLEPGILEVRLRAPARRELLRRAIEEEPATSGSADNIQRSSARAVIITCLRRDLGSGVRRGEGRYPVARTSPYDRHGEDRSLYGRVVAVHDRGGRDDAPLLPRVSGRHGAHGDASLADIDSGVVKRCEECRMDPRRRWETSRTRRREHQQRLPEHYWRIGRRSWDYQKARRTSRGPRRT